MSFFSQALLDAEYCGSPVDPNTGLSNKRVYAEPEAAIENGCKTLQPSIVITPALFDPSTKITPSGVKDYNLTVNSEDALK